MRFAIVGCRDYTNERFIFSILERMLHQGDVVISGGAKGVDTLAKLYAIRYNHQFVEYKANWEKYGSKAGPIRNEKIVEDCNEVIAFWDSKSRGTKNTLKLAREAGKSVHIFWI